MAFDTGIRTAHGNGIDRISSITAGEPNGDNSTRQPASEGIVDKNDVNVHETVIGDDGNITRVTTSGDRSSSETEDSTARAFEQLETKKSWFAYLKTRDFYIILVLGQILALCITGSNTFSSKLVEAGTSLPAFQSIFNYTLLTLVYTSFTLYKYGFRKYGKLLLKDGWKYLLLSFLDVEGNYFTILCYRYTTILSAQLLNFWAIVCVVIVSFTLLKVRYKLFQILGILICVGGMGILLASDHIQGSNGGNGVNELKGDLFGLLGATLYGLSNVFEEWFVSRRPAYEVLNFLGLFGVIITGVQCAIFDRADFEKSSWEPAVGGWIIGFTLVMFTFYSIVPVLLRMASAAFFDISLLTANFWGTIIGIKVFGYIIHWMYPIAFVLIIIGQMVYFLAGSMLGDSKKPWLGANQEEGVDGLGTARNKAIRKAKKLRLAEEESV